jgi:hypothetical protein
MGFRFHDAESPGGGTAQTQKAGERCDELSAGSFGCGNDLVEARITAQIIPARIELEIAV